MFLIFFFCRWVFSPLFFFPFHFPLLSVSSYVSVRLAIISSLLYFHQSFPFISPSISSFSLLFTTFLLFYHLHYLHFFYFTSLFLCEVIPLRASPHLSSPIPPFLLIYYLYPSSPSSAPLSPVFPSLPFMTLDPPLHHPLQFIIRRRPFIIIIIILLIILPPHRHLHHT